MTTYYLNKAQSIQSMTKHVWHNFIPWIVRTVL